MALFSSKKHIKIIQRYNIKQSWRFFVVLDVFIHLEQKINHERLCNNHKYCEIIMPIEDKTI